MAPGPSIWQRFSHDPRLMAAKGDTGDVACDHYNRMESDVALMKAAGAAGVSLLGRLGPRAARGDRARSTRRASPSTSGWSTRCSPTGSSRCARCIHWDLPAALDDRGGWLNRDIADWFADYARVLFERLDGRVKKWVTLNEPWVVTDGGYLHGALAPGHRNMFEAPIASHNLMRAHGAAVQVYREVGAHEIGLVVNIEPKYPATDSAEDAAATSARRRLHEPPVSRSRRCWAAIPAELQEIFGEAWPDWPAEDWRSSAQPIDFVGINYYTRNVVTRTTPAGR